MLAPLAVAATLAAGAVSDADLAGIRRAALDYAESWYEGDPAKMERALSPDLAKRIVRVGPNGEMRLDHMGAMRLVQRVREGIGTKTPEDKRRKDVSVLDVTGNAATVKLVMSGWVDYLHVAKLDGRWQIVNVLWELLPEEPAK
jgi:hypothetical protein